MFLCVDPLTERAGLQYGSQRFIMIRVRADDGSC